MKRPHFFTSFLSIHCRGSKPFTSPANRTAWRDVSKSVIGAIPGRPASAACHVASVPIPSGDTRPIPVTTTRRRDPRMGLEPPIDLEPRIDLIGLMKSGGSGTIRTYQIHLWPRFIRGLDSPVAARQCSDSARRTIRSSESREPLARRSGGARCGETAAENGFTKFAGERIGNREGRARSADVPRRR